MNNLIEVSWLPDILEPENRRGSSGERCEALWPSDNSIEGE